MPRKVKTESGADLGIRIGRNIKIARAKIGITQSEMAEALGVESVTVSRIETGAQLPSIDRLELIAKVLKVSLPALVSDTNKNDTYGALLAEVIKDLPMREKEFVYGFALSYVQHWRAGKKK